MASLTLVLFRDGSSASDAVAVLRDIVRTRAGHYAFTEIDVQDRPELAVQYDPAREERRHCRPNCRHTDHVPCAQPPRHTDAARHGCDTVWVAAHTDAEYIDAVALS